VTVSGSSLRSLGLSPDPTAVLASTRVRSSCWSLAHRETIPRTRFEMADRISTGSISHTATTSASSGKFEPLSGEAIEEAPDFPVLHVFEMQAATRGSVGVRVPLGTNTY